MMRNITEILDTTLREGEQCFGVFFPIEIKKQIALLLDRIGVDFIEVGHPAAAPSIRQAVSEIASLHLTAKLVGHARLDRDEIKLVKDLGLNWIGLFCGINNHARRKYGLSKNDILRKASESIQFAKALGLSVRFTCEDASRTEPEDVLLFFRFLASIGVDRVSYADTVGISTPAGLKRTCRLLKTELPLGMVHFHLHDDSGHALANTLVVMDEQAGCIDTSILGVGERVGIVRLEQALEILNRTGRIDNYAYDRKNGFITQTAMLVASCINGENYALRRRAHKSGVHINGVLKDTAMYETDDPKLTGDRRIIVLSKLIGRSGLQHMLRSYGYWADGPTTQCILKKIKNEEMLELFEKEKIEDYFTKQGAQKAPVVSTGDRTRTACCCLSG